MSRVQEFAHKVLTFATFDEWTKFRTEQSLDYDLQNEQGCTLLMTACAIGRVDLAKDIAEKTKNIQACTFANQTTAVFFAARSNSVELLELLVQFFPDEIKPLINGVNVNGDTPLMMACVRRNFDIVKTLLQHGADPRLCNKALMSPLMCASTGCAPEVMNQSQNIMQILLEHCPESINGQNSQGQSALHIAVSNTNVIAVDSLLQVNYNPDVQLTDSKSMTAFQLAKQRGDATIIGLFEAYFKSAEQRTLGNLESLVESDSFKPPFTSTKPKSKKKKKRSIQRPSKTTIVKSNCETQESIIQPAPAEGLLTTIHIDDTNSSEWKVIKSGRAVESVLCKENDIEEGKQIHPEACIPEEELISNKAAATDNPKSLVNSDLYRALEDLDPSVRDLDIPVESFFCIDLDCLSMAQLDILERAHLEAFHRISNMKIELAKSLAKAQTAAEFHLAEELRSP